MAHEMYMGEDGILRIRFSGDFDKEDIKAYMEDLAPILEAATETIHFLVDVSQAGKMSVAARKAFGEIFREPHPRTGKTAMVGASRYIRVVASFGIKAARPDDLRFFGMEKEALAWLEED